MAEVYIYPPDCEDFSTIGECGRLDARLCDCELVANGMIELTLEHPIDRLGRYLLLQEDWILKTEIPVLTTPEIAGGAYVTSVQRWTVSPGATKAQRTVWSKQTKGKKKKVLKAGTEVIVVSAPATGSRYKVKTGKVTGWMETEALIDEVEVPPIPATATGMESAVPSWELREQTFRIYDVDQTDDKVTVYAKARSYDLAYNLSTYNNDGEVDLQTAASGIFGNTLDSHEAEIYTDIQGTRVGVHARDLNPIEALLDPEEGLCARWNAQLVRDEMDFYLLASAGRDRGICIEYARNLSGIHMSTNVEDVFTHVRPIGETKAGGPLYLAENDGLMACPNANKYPFKRIYPLKVSEAKVDKDVNTQLARTRLSLAGQALIDQGIDEPKVDAKISFERLGSTPRYAQYRALRDQVFPFDTVHILHPRLNIDMTAQVVRLKWDCLREETKDMDVGSLSKLSPSVSSWQISGGISGAKLAEGSVGGIALKDGAIDVRHVQADSINAEAIQAESITADHLAAHAVDAQSLTAVEAEIRNVSASNIHTNTLAAAFASLFSVVAGKISAREIEADKLDAIVENVVTLTAGSADFDVETVRHLVSSVLSVTRLIGGMARIDNLYVTNANLVNATLDALTVKGSDDNYYDIAVGSDGVLSAMLREVTQAEIDAGETTDGRGIVGDVDLDVVGADGIDGKYIEDAETGLMTLYVSALSAGHITATTAFIGSGQIPSLETTSVKALGKSIDISANETILMQTGDDTKGLRRVLRLDLDGLHVGDHQASGEVLIDSESVNVVMYGNRYSRFAANYAQFGNYQLRRTSDGGLVFKMAL